ncbi:MAG: DUF433 domain-containing protein [Leptospiraceae bacterium]|nr:DUF433 domain-containing protein [Leptospiraceae bacterium]
MSEKIQQSPNATIVSDPAVLMGKPIIAGTRISVEIILDKLANGETIDQILVSYPHLNRKMIQVAIEFAKEAANKEKIYAIA